MTVVTRTLAALAIAAGAITAVGAAVAHWTLPTDGPYRGFADVDDLRLILVGFTILGVALVYVGRKAIR